MRHRWTIGAESRCPCGARRAWIELDKVWVHWTRDGEECRREPKCTRRPDRPRRGVQLGLFGGDGDGK